MIRIQNVLVATDFSQPSAAALQYGRELARTFNATLRVLHVRDLPYAVYAGETFAAPALPDLLREIETGVQQQVKAMLTEEDQTTLRAKAVVVTAVAKAEAIVAYAEANQVDVIVMGTHGRGAIGHLLMGSVAERVVRMATCPVLTVHQPQHECIVPDSPVAVAVAVAQAS